MDRKPTVNGPLIGLSLFAGVGDSVTIERLKKKINQLITNQEDLDKRIMLIEETLALLFEDVDMAQGDLKMFVGTLEERRKKGGEDITFKNVRF